MKEVFNVLVVGLGHMGLSHARSYRKHDGFRVVGLVSRDANKRREVLEEFAGVPHYTDFYEALEASQPHVVSVNTYVDTHFEFAKAAMEKGAHVFLEKPIAQTIGQAEELVSLAKKLKRKLVVGYILRQHPAWDRLVKESHQLGKPLVMRMNLNQQSFGDEWQAHKNLMSNTSPIVDCGVHYVDMMCLMTQSRPKSVHAIGARLTEEISENMTNYGQLQVEFTDGSVGWYEAGWGPMISEEAYFIKDVMGPHGAVSLAKKQQGGSADIEGHTKTDGIRIHAVARDVKGILYPNDVFEELHDDPDHQELCDREQEVLYQAMLHDHDLSVPMQAAIDSLKIVLEANESIQTGQKRFF